MYILRYIYVFHSGRQEGFHPHPSFLSSFLAIYSFIFIEYIPEYNVHMYLNIFIFSILVGKVFSSTHFLSVFISSHIMFTFYWIYIPIYISKYIYVFHSGRKGVFCPYPSFLSSFLVMFYIYWKHPRVQCTYLNVFMFSILVGKRVFVCSLLNIIH